MIPTRELGQTGLVVSRLGLGLAALGRPGYVTLGHATDLRSDYRVTALRDLAHAVLDGPPLAKTAYPAGPAALR